jgi:hypothetical protein
MGIVMACDAPDGEGRTLLALDDGFQRKNMAAE